MAPMLTEGKSPKALKKNPRDGRGEKGSEAETKGDRESKGERKVGRGRTISAPKKQKGEKRPQAHKVR